MKVVLNSSNYRFKFFFLKTLFPKVFLGRTPIVAGAGVRMVFDKSSKIIFGKKVILQSNSELRSIDNGILRIDNLCKIDNQSRLIARNNQIHLAENVKIGIGSVLNGGGGISVGTNTSLYGYVNILSSTHLDKGSLMQSGDKNYHHQKVDIGENVLIMPCTIIKPGTVIDDNLTIGKT